MKENTCKTKRKHTAWCIGLLSALLLFLTAFLIWQNISKPIHGTFCSNDRLPENQITFSFLKDGRFFLRASETEETEGAYELTDTPESVIVKLVYSGEKMMFAVYDKDDSLYLCTQENGVIPLHRISQNAIVRSKEGDQ